MRGHERVRMQHRLDKRQLCATIMREPKLLLGPRHLRRLRRVSMRHPMARHVAATRAIRAWHAI